MREVRAGPARYVRHAAHALHAVGRRQANESAVRALPRRENGCENLFVRADVQEKLLKAYNDTDEE